MQDPLYRDIIFELAERPHWFGTLPAPTRMAGIRNPSCGDSFTVQVGSATAQGIEVMFHGTGCAISLAGGSLICDYLRAHDASAILRSDESTVLRTLELSFVTPARIQCAILAWRGFVKAFD